MIVDPPGVMIVDVMEDVLVEGALAPPPLFGLTVPDAPVYPTRRMVRVV